MMVQLQVGLVSVLLLMFNVSLLLDAQQDSHSCPINNHTVECCDCPSYVTLYLPEHIVRGAPGENISVHCNRTCGRQFHDRWLIQIWNEFRIIKQNMTLEFKHVHLSTDNTDSSTCSDLSIEYSLHLKNINMDINGLVIHCGIENLYNYEVWYAPFSTQVVLVNSSTNELNATLTQALKDLNRTNQDLNTCNRTLNTKKLCTTEIGVSIGLGLLVFIMMIMILVLCIAVCFLKKKLKKKNKTAQGKTLS